MLRWRSARCHLDITHGPAGSGRWRCSVLTQRIKQEQQPGGIRGQRGLGGQRERSWRMDDVDTERTSVERSDAPHAASEGRVPHREKACVSIHPVRRLDPVWWRFPGSPQVPTCT